MAPQGDGVVGGVVPGGSVTVPVRYITVDFTDIHHMKMNQSADV